LELIRSIFKQDQNSPRKTKQSKLPEGAGNRPEGGLLFKPSEASHSANSKDSNMKPAVPARILATLSPVLSQNMISDSRALQQKVCAPSVVTVNA